MITDVKKSLVLWPLAASLVVVLLSWPGSHREGVLRLLGKAGLITNQACDARFMSKPSCNGGIPSVDVEVLHARLLPPTSRPAALERSVQGIRPIQPPARMQMDQIQNATSRLTESPIKQIAAPVRNEVHELAGLHFAPTHTYSASNATSHLLKEVEPFILHASQSIASIKKNFSASFSNQSAGSQHAGSIMPKSVSVLGNLAQPAESESARSVSRSNQSDSLRKSSLSMPSGWPLTPKLEQSMLQLEQVAAESAAAFDSTSTEIEAVLRWTNNVRDSLATIRELPRLGDPRAEESIDRLNQLFQQGESLADASKDRNLQIAWLYACYALQRRVVLWKPIWQLSHSSDLEQVATTTLVNVRSNRVESGEILQSINALRDILPETKDPEGWSEYLLLEQIERTAKGNPLEDHAMLAKRVLSRLRWHGLHREHRLWLDNDHVADFVTAVKPWTRGAIDYARLLNQVEHQEANEIDTISVEIAAAIQTLQHAQYPTAVKVADSLDTYYRNANVRIAVSDHMLQMMLPPMQTHAMPVHAEMLGSQVRGSSRVHSNLQIRLVPSPDRWRMELQTLGNVQTSTVGYKGPVAVHSAGISDFAASTPIEISSDGLQLKGSAVDAQANNRLKGIETDYDFWPLIGSLVRSIAKSQYESLSPISNRISSEMIRNQVSNEIDNRLEQQISETARRLSQVLLGPLGALNLDPRVVDMQTTEQRLIARYRVAGDWQLGGFTPRPRALRDSLMSVQVHQSAINNTLEQLVPRDQPRLISEMITEGAMLFGQSEFTVPEDFPDDVRIQFAPTRPITVEIEDDRLWLTLRIVRLTNSEQLDLRRFIVRAAYKPVFNGLDATLQRDGHLNISGPNLSMRDRLPIRAIFNKALSPNQGIPLTIDALKQHPAATNLAISQLELREGWLALAVGDSPNHESQSRTP